MDQQNIVQAKKGIWIQQDLDSYLVYTTWLRERTEDVVSFIPFDHSYQPIYLGSVGFINIEDHPHLIHSCGVDHGLMQNKFYPLGGTPLEDRPELVGKGLARKIEFGIATDLTKKFSADTPIVIAAVEPGHLKYCERVGLTPYKATPLDEYVRVLTR